MAHSVRRLSCAAAAAVLLGCLGPALLAVAADALDTSLYRGGGWTDDRGRAVDLADYAGRRTALTMAYSTCKRTCSFTLKKLLALQADADRDGVAMEFVIVSYDPANDDAAAWRDYRNRHHLHRDNWHFLTAGSAQTRALAARLGLADYWSYDDHVMHDFAIVLLNREGRIEKRFGWSDQSG